MDRHAAITLLDRLHEAQNEFYAGGSDRALKQLLASNVTWTVPGDTDHTFKLKRRDVLVGDGDRLAALTDGFATIRDVDHRWSTVGLYDVVDQRIAACWLLPLDQHAFDAIWSA